jgi:hypothetical protein
VTVPSEKKLLVFMNVNGTTADDDNLCFATDTLHSQTAGDQHNSPLGEENAHQRISRLIADNGGGAFMYRYMFPATLFLAPFSHTLDKWIFCCPHVGILSNHRHLQHSLMGSSMPSALLPSTSIFNSVFCVETKWTLYFES